MKGIVSGIRWSTKEIALAAPLPGAIVIALTVLEGLAPVLSIYVTQHFIDAVIHAAGQGRQGYAAVWPWVAAFAGSLLLSFEVLWKFRDPALTWIRHRLQYRLERRRLAHAAALPLTFFEESASYDKLSRCADPGRKTADLFFQTLMLAKGSISVIGIAVLFWNVSPWLAVALVAVIVPRAIYGAKSSQMWMSFAYDQTEEHRRAAYVSGVLTGRGEQKELRVFDLAGTLGERWESLRKEQRDKALQVKKGMELRSFPSQTLYWITEVAVVVVLGLWLAPQRITPGIFMSLFQGVGKMNAGASSISFGIGLMHTHAVNVGYVREFLQIPAEDDKQEKQPFPAPLREGIRLSGVSFAYPGREKPILQGLDLQLRPGERVALVGENGAGKSTLVKLLLGLYKPGAGTVTADGVDYADIAPESLHDHVSAAYQDYYKFAFTAAQSVAMRETAGTAADAAGEAFRERVRTAAVRGGADEFIAGLPQGYDTPIGHLFDGSRGLSEGQWQRIAISRTFMRDPQLLVLDEPTAALDAKAEADIYGQFMSAARDRAVLLISHRLGSARLADRIIVLRDGRIAEDGTHDQLLAAGGTYARMWEVQSQWYR